MKEAQGRLAEEALYSQVAEEIATGIRREGLWAKAIADSDGSAERARALYIRFRVQSLFDEAEVKRFAKMEEDQRAEVEAQHQEQDQIGQRVEELRVQEQKATTVPVWLVCIVVVVLFVIIGKILQR